MRTKLCLICSMILSLFMLAILISISLAGDNCWTSEKLFGGEISDIVIHAQDRNIMYCYQACSGIYKSVDGGKNWKKVTSDISINSTLYGDLRIDPVNLETIYFLDDKTVYKSIDSGVTWTSITIGISKNNLSDFDINPFNNQELILGSAGTGFFQTDNGGATWIKKNVFGSSSVYVTEYDDYAINRIYVGTVMSFSPSIDDGFSWSENNGSTWTYIEEGLKNLGTIDDIEVDPNNHDIIYIVGKGRIYSNYHPPDTQPFHCIYRSVDRGKNWTCINNGLNVNRAKRIEVHPNNSDLLYICTPLQGVWRSRDRGQSWESCNTNVGNLMAKCITIDEVNNILYLGTFQSGIFKSLDEGQTWLDCNQGIDGLCIISINFNPVNSRTIYLSRTEYPLKSIDGGQNWFPLGIGTLDEVYAYDIKIDPVDTSIIYLGAFNKRFGQEAYTNNGFFISFDAGNHWEKRSYGLPEDVDILCLNVFAQKERKIIYIGTNHGMYRSHDLGKSWQSTNNGIDDAFMIVLSVAVAKEDSNIVFAGFPTGVYKTMNGGVSWKKVSHNFSGFSFNCYVDPNNANRVVITCSTSSSQSQDGGAFVSEDGGKTWKQFAFGPRNVFAFSPHNPNHLLLGGFYGEVFFGENGFDNLEVISEGFNSPGDTPLLISCLAFDPVVPNKFYCGAYNWGVHSYTKTSLSVKDKKSITTIPLKFDLGQNQPNPFNPETRIQYEIPKEGHVILTILNLSGQKIATLVDTINQPGRHEVTWSGKSDTGEKVASGMYFYQLSMNNHRIIMKMTLLR